MSRKTALLTDRGVIRVSGEGAAPFLQGLLTNDVEKLNANEACYAALLTPQGKILFDMIVISLPAAGGADFLIDCAAAQTADLVKRLGFYRLRAKVAIADESATHAVVAGWDDEPERSPGQVVYADPRESGLGWRAVLPRDEALPLGTDGEASYEARRIGVGVPKGGVDFAYGDAFPHDANFDLLNGLDFDKGCYVGQEVVSRMRHRGAARKRIARMKLAGEPPPPGAAILDGALPVGTLGSSSGREALALVRLDRVEEAKAARRALTADGVELALAE